MTKQIKTYKDLLEEKQRLEDLFRVQKAVIREDFREIGTELKPVKSALNFAGKFFTRDSHNLLLNASANTLINVFVKKILLARMGWFTKLVVPFLIKNYSSHLIFEKKGNLLRKLFAWVGKKNANGREKVHEDEKED